METSRSVTWKMTLKPPPTLMLTKPDSQFMILNVSFHKLVDSCWSTGIESNDIHKQI